MPGVRILLSGISKEWRHLLRELALEEGMEVVGEASEPFDLLLQAKHSGADVVVLSQLENGAEPGVCSHLLLEYPNRMVLLLPASPGAGTPCWIVLRREVMKSGSRDDLRDLLRNMRSYIGDESAFN
jgi:DNA-binding NarL/FixJ family response regulator